MRERGNAAGQVTKLLKPIFEDFSKHLQAHDFAKAAVHLDPDYVVVHAGHKAIYGREALKKSYEEAVQKYGKGTPKITPQEFHKSGSFIIVCGHTETNTEKMGLKKANFTHLWRKHGDTYLLLYDEVKEA
ncbi:hypothetical protein OESDEN_08857 [Oesophagostomum dentatum]|uniref:DUF4440 domain-containing protein n=1 Tax=Oesophagostomum dentatum TaxID=61180 RepID=A0A0B1T570_OESDE|nr:hypothetical protein OESDEN_08857 [Oesophagostomum dentatum]